MIVQNINHLATNKQQPAMLYCNELTHDSNALRRRIFQYWMNLLLDSTKPLHETLLVNTIK